MTPVAYKGIMWCPTVSTGAFVARRNGKVFVTGNSGFPKVKTVLKPALEPITLARKPGKSALQIDLCRVGTESTRRVSNAGTNGEGWGMGKSAHMNGSDAGRWPANIITDGSDEVLALFPTTGSSSAKPRNNAAYKSVAKGHEKAHVTHGHEDAGGSAARFFYCAKTNSTDRNEGCEDLPDKDWSGDGAAVPERANRPFNPSKNNHPTVKPTALMRYLCRLVTPPGGLILDPWMGSGSTGKAAKLEGFDFIGMEREAEYFKIAQARCGVEIFTEEDFWG